MAPEKGYLRLLQLYTYKNTLIHVHMCIWVAAHTCNIWVHDTYTGTYARAYMGTHMNTHVHRYTHKRNQQDQMLQQHAHKKSQRCTQTQNTPYKSTMDRKATLNGLTSWELKPKTRIRKGNSSLWPAYLTSTANRNRAGLGQQKLGKTNPSLRCRASSVS